MLDYESLRKRFTETLNSYSKDDLLNWKKIDKQQLKTNKMTTAELIDNFKDNKISVEYVLEQLSDMGHCPALIFDDNGHWAVTSAGVQDVSLEEGPSDISTCFFIEAHEWKNTVREAVLYYLEN